MVKSAMERDMINVQGGPAAAGLNVQYHLFGALALDCCCHLQLACLPLCGNDKSLSASFLSGPVWRHAKPELRVLLVQALCVGFLPYEQSRQPLAHVYTRH